MKFSIKDFFSKSDQIRSTSTLKCDFNKVAKQILNGKLYFLCSDMRK